MNAEIKSLKSSPPLVRLFGNEIKSKKYNEACALSHKTFLLCNLQVGVTSHCVLILKMFQAKSNI